MGKDTGTDGAGSGGGTLTGLACSAAHTGAARVAADTEDTELGGEEWAARTSAARR